MRQLQQKRNQRFAINFCIVCLFKVLLVNSSAELTPPQTRLVKRGARITAGGDDAILDPKKVELGSEQIQYCAKVMRANFHEFHLLCL